MTDDGGTTSSNNLIIERSNVDGAWIYSAEESSWALTQIATMPYSGMNFDSLSMNEDKIMFCNYPDYFDDRIAYGYDCSMNGFITKDISGVTYYSNNHIINNGDNLVAESFLSKVLFLIFTLCLNNLKFSPFNRSFPLSEKR